MAAVSVGVRGGYAAHTEQGQPVEEEEEPRGGAGGGGEYTPRPVQLLYWLLETAVHH